MSNEVVKSQENTLFDPKNISKTSFGVQGLVGYTTQDLPIPYLKLVQKMTEDKMTDKGTEAKEGQLMHSNTKVTFDKISLVVLFAKKGTKTFVNPATKELEAFEEHRLLCVTKDNLDPFVIFLKKASIGAWKKFLGTYLSMKPKYTFEYEVVVSSETYTNKNQQAYKVFKFELGSKLDEESTKKVMEVASKYDASLVDSALEADTPKTTDDDLVDLNEIPF